MNSNKNSEIVAQTSKKIESEVTVFATQTNVGATVYRIEETLSENVLNNKRSTLLFGTIGSYEIKPTDALDLYSGSEIAILFQTKSGDFVPAYIAAKDIHIKTSISTNDITYENQQLIVGLAFPLIKRGTLDEIYAYNIDQTKFFSKLTVFGTENHSIQLNASDCLKLSARNRITKFGYEVVRNNDRTIEFANGRVHRTAKLRVYSKEHSRKSLLCISYASNTI